MNIRDFRAGFKFRICRKPKYDNGLSDALIHNLMSYPVEAEVIKIEASQVQSLPNLNHVWYKVKGLTGNQLSYDDCLVEVSEPIFESVDYTPLLPGNVSEGLIVCDKANIGRIGRIVRHNHALFASYDNPAQVYVEWTSPRNHNDIVTIYNLMIVPQNSEDVPLKVEDLRTGLNVKETIQNRTGRIVPHSNGSLHHWVNGTHCDVCHVIMKLDDGTGNIKFDIKHLVKLKNQLNPYTSYENKEESSNIQEQSSKSSEGKIVKVRRPTATILSGQSNRGFEVRSKRQAARFGR